MKINLKDYLEKFENRETIKAFSLVGGPDITGRHFCKILSYYKENYDTELDEQVMRFSEDCSEEEVVEDCSVDIANYLEDGTHMDEFQEYISIALREMDYDDVDIEDLMEEDLEDLEEIINQATYIYLLSQVEKHTEEFFTSYLIKYVLLPNGIKYLDSSIFDKFFHSKNKYGYIGSETNHTPLIDGFKQCLKDNGIEL